jgi:hypothetical protein
MICVACVIGLRASDHSSHIPQLLASGGVEQPSSRSMKQGSAVRRLYLKVTTKVPDLVGYK